MLHAMLCGCLVSPCARSFFADTPEGHGRVKPRCSLFASTAHKGAPLVPGVCMMVPCALSKTQLRLKGNFAKFAGRAKFYFKKKYFYYR